MFAKPDFHVMGETPGFSLLDRNAIFSEKRKSQRNKNQNKSDSYGKASSVVLNFLSAPDEGNGSGAGRGGGRHFARFSPSVLHVWKMTAIEQK